MGGVAKFGTFDMFSGATSLIFKIFAKYPEMWSTSSFIN